MKRTWMLHTLGFLTGGVGGLAGGEDEPNALGEVTQENLGQCFRLILLKDLNLLCFGLSIGYTLQNLRDEGLTHGQLWCGGTKAILNQIITKVIIALIACCVYLA